MASVNSILLLLCFSFSQVKGTDQRLELNRRVLQLMGNVNVIPWRFDQNGMKATSTISKLRWNIWILTFGPGMTYAACINVILMQTFMLGMKNVRYDQLGAYEFFVAHSEKLVMLYNFVQSNPGINYFYESKLVQHSPFSF